MTTARGRVAGRAIYVSVIRLICVSALAAAAACAGGGDGIVSAKPPAGPLPDAVRSVTLTPTTATVTVTQSVALNLSVDAAAPSVATVTTYTSAAPNIATVSAAGSVTGVAPGTAVITATTTGSGTGYTTSSKSATATITVTPLPDALRGVSVAPTSGSVTVGQTLSLVSVADAVNASVGVSYAYATTVPAVATVSQSGVVSGVAPGTTVITVTATGSGTGYATTTKAATATITVTAAPNALNGVTLTPSSSGLSVGQTQTLTPLPDRATPSVAMSYAYESNSLNIATVSLNGVVTGVAPGTATITVTATGSLTGFTTTTRTATATTTVSALPNALTGVALAPTNATIAVGRTQTLTPAPSRASTSVDVNYTYTSSAPSVATVTQQGVVTGVSPGNASITVTATGSGAGYTTSTSSATASISVTNAPNALNSVTLSPSSSSVSVGQFQSLTPVLDRATSGVTTNYVYQSSAPGIASVTQQGVVTGVSPGSATITVTATGSASGYTTNTLTATATIAVSAAPNALLGLSLTPLSATVPVGQTQTLSPATSRASTSVDVFYQYVSSAPSVASVSQQGTVTGLSPGTTTMTVTASGSGFGYTATTLTATATITVIDIPNALNGVTLSPGSTGVAVGQSVTLTPIPNRSSAGVTVSYSYQSNATNIASVTQQGVVTGVAPGAATITVFATGSGVGFTTTITTATTDVTVSPNGGSQVAPVPAAINSLDITQSSFAARYQVRFGSEDTYYWVEYSTTPSFAGFINSAQQGPGCCTSVTRSTSAIVAGLTPNTTYYWRVRAWTSFVSVVSATATFKTLP